MKGLTDRVGLRIKSRIRAGPDEKLESEEKETERLDLSDAVSMPPWPSARYSERGPTETPRRFRLKLFN